MKKFEKGEAVRILPAADGSTIGGTWVFEKNSRLSYKVVVRDLETDTTMHVATYRVVALGPTACEADPEVEHDACAYCEAGETSEHNPETRDDALPARFQITNMRGDVVDTFGTEDAAREALAGYDDTHSVEPLPEPTDGTFVDAGGFQ